LTVKLDENLPERLVDVLTGLGHDVDTVRSEGLIGSDDFVIWDAAQSAKRFLVTQDLDFSDMRRYEPGAHAGLLLLRLANPGRASLFERVWTLFSTEPVEEWRGCLVVATDRKIRIRRPHDSAR
jgi:predicted nuclease of predicted toxin-antitoxin system